MTLENEICVVGDVWRAGYQDGTAWPFSDHTVIKVDGENVTLARPYLYAFNAGTGALTGVETYTVQVGSMKVPYWTRVDTGRVT